MTVLLDTHVLLWAISTPDRLSQRARALIEDRRTAVNVSAVSAWEISIKHGLGRLPEAETVLSTWSATLDRLGATPLPISDEHAILAGRLAWDHRDPFDRMLAAQSVIEGAILLTDDSWLRRAPGVTVAW